MTLVEEMRDIYRRYTGSEIAQAIRTIRVELDSQAEEQAVRAQMQLLEDRLEKFGSQPHS